MKNGKKGFTVVELVIVIAVIAILSGILVPTFVGLVGRAQETALQANLNAVYDSYSAEVEPEELKAKAEVYVVVVTEGENNTEVKTAYQINANGDWEVNADAELVEAKKHGPYNTNYYIYEI